MDAMEMIAALTMLTTLPDAAETPGEPPPWADGSDSLPEDGTPMYAVYNAEGRISSAKADQLLAACGDDVPLMDLMLEVKVQTGETHMGNILTSQYDAILAWINKQIDAKIAGTQNH